MKNRKSARRLEALLEKLVDQEKATCMLLSGQIEALESSYIRLAEISTDPSATVGGRLCGLAFTPLQRRIDGATAAYAAARQRVQDRGGQLRLAGKAALEAGREERSRQEQVEREAILERAVPLGWGKQNE